ncbi:MAG: hypothetical protein HYX92_17610 [Chloroflexi bacterium]|nr:hypothetical protein [Chloroflexota bacterium]
MANGRLAAESGPAKGLTPSQWRARVTEAVLASFSLHSLPTRMPRDKVFDAFCKLSVTYPDWLGSLYFERAGKSCVSKGIEEVLFALGAFQLVTVENHDYRFLRIEPDTSRQIKEGMKSRLSADELRDLEKLSNDFAKLIRASAEGADEQTKGRG